MKYSVSSYLIYSMQNFFNLGDLTRLTCEEVVLALKRAFSPRDSIGSRQAKTIFTVSLPKCRSDIQSNFVDIVDIDR
jgi:hypothetical protein